MRRSWECRERRVYTSFGEHGSTWWVCVNKTFRVVGCGESGEISRRGLQGTYLDHTRHEVTRPPGTNIQSSLRGSPPLLRIRRKSVTVAAPARSDCDDTVNVTLRFKRWALND